MNLYGYCLDDPVNFVDPTGENPWLVRFAIGALAGIAEEMLFEMWDNFQNGRPWDCVDWGQIGLAGLFGGLASAGLGGLGAKIGGKLKELLGRWMRGGKNWVNLASKGRTQHILYGDATGGGHKWGLSRLFNGKSKFPIGWSDDKIMHAVSDVATSPNSKWIQQTGPAGSFFQKNGVSSKWLVTGKYEGVDISVVVQGDDIITAFPF